MGTAASCPGPPALCSGTSCGKTGGSSEQSCTSSTFFFFYFFYFAVVAISMLVASWWDGSCACALSWTCMLLKSDVPNPKGFSSRKSSAAPEEAVPDG